MMSPLPSRRAAQSIMSVVAPLLVLILSACAGHLGAGAESRDDVQVAVYYFPNYHVDPVNEEHLGAGWTEWDLVRNARPMFSGHDQPKRPLWGYRDEADPREMARSIDAMADHGVDAILFDWYRYDNGVGFLDGALNRGFFSAPNRNRVHFALMWANHDANTVWTYPWEPGRPGAVDRTSFDRITKEAIDDYFSQPNYWRVGGRPYFSIYELQTLIHGLGGLAQTREALADFRARSETAGAGGVHLNLVGLGLTTTLERLRSGAIQQDPHTHLTTEADIVAYFAADSVTVYHGVQVAAPATPTETYESWATRAASQWTSWQDRLPIAFHPNVSVGWDGSPRNYPMGVIVDNTPEQIERAFLQAREYLDTQPEDRRVLVVNAWNEWSEGSYLEPDQVHGTGFLEALGRTFPRRDSAGVRETTDVAHGDRHRR